MRCTPTLVALTLTLFAFPALPQQAPATGSIEGIVVRSDIGLPIAAAEVTLSPDSTGAAGNNPSLQRPGPIAPVTTGADGKFSLKDLSPGAYRLAATASGFVRQEYEQRALFGTGRVLYLSAGQEFKDAAVRLTPAGIVSGHVYDELGQPATGAQVQLLRAAFNVQGSKVYSLSGNTVADDRGAYRIFGITPGRYYLVAGTTSGVGSLGAGPTTPRFSVVYYPNSANLEHAAAVEVTAGGDLSFNMRVTRQVKTFRVRGRVVDGTGTGIPTGLNIMLGWQSFNSAGVTVGVRTIDAATGAFEMQNVPPGEYSLVAQLPPTLPGRDAVETIARQAEQASQPSASIPIRVVDSDIEGMVLTLNTGAVVNGRIVVDGKPLSSVPNLERQRISLNTPRGGAGLVRIPGSIPAATAIAADGTFQLKGIREEEYRLQMSVPGFYVASVKYGKDEILGKLLRYRRPSGPDSEAIEVTLRATSASVSGIVTDDKMQPVSGVNVVFVPVDGSRLELFRTVPTDQNGRYSMTSLAPGEYKAFSWESIDNNAYFDPEFLKQYELLGQAIVVSESTNSGVDLKLIPAQ